MTEAAKPSRRRRSAKRAKRTQPASTPATPAVVEGMTTVTIVGPKAGRWRAGRKFDATPTTIAIADLTADELAAFEADPRLSVSFEADAPAA